MRVFLDDIRNSPPGWVVVRTAAEAIALLRTGEVTEMSLDHDLGGDSTGMEVLEWIEWEVVERGFEPPQLIVHSGNPVGRERMRAAVESIERLRRQRDDAGE
jgi:hypothetical protein